MKFNQWVIITLLLSSAVAQAGESGAAIKSDTLRSAPFSDAKGIATLPAGSTVKILKRQGGWYQVKTARGNGWVRMLSVRRGNQSSSGSSAATLAGLASGRAGTGKVVSTTGIRGLNEEELKAAHFDEQQISLTESYLTSRTAAQKFASNAKLKAIKMDYLPESSGAAR